MHRIVVKECEVMRKKERNRVNGRGDALFILITIDSAPQEADIIGYRCPCVNVHIPLILGPCGVLGS